MQSWRFAPHSAQGELSEFIYAEINVRTELKYHKIIRNLPVLSTFGCSAEPVTLFIDHVKYTRICHKGRCQSENKMIWSWGMCRLKI